MFTTAYILLVLYCSGHTNATCEPKAYRFSSFEVCESVRLNDLTNPDQGVCIPTD